MLLICGGLGAWTHHSGSLPHTTELVEIACGVVAMGLQSMLARSLKLPMTHVMTGNVTQLTVDVLDSRFGRSDCMAAARRSVFLVAAFAGGAALAGVMVPTFGFAVLLLPAVVLLGVARTLD